MRAFLMLAFAAALYLSAPVEAACECTCVDGKFQSLCASPKDKPRDCSRRDFCPKAPASVAPPLPNEPMPPGAKRCRMAQVYQHMKVKYEWKRICE
jgi:hypothetical protein